MTTIQKFEDVTFVGFTGTPIDKGFKRTTLGVFGALIDSYTIPQSVEDGATVPIHYEARLPEMHVEGPETLDDLFEALFGNESEETRAETRRRYANRERVAEPARRIETIALDIAGHFREKVQPNGFKAQVVASSRAAALRYTQHLNDFKYRAGLLTHGASPCSCGSEPPTCSWNTCGRPWRSECMWRTTSPGFAAGPGRTSPFMRSSSVDPGGSGRPCAGISSSSSSVQYQPPQVHGSKVTKVRSTTSGPPTPRDWR